MKVKERRKIRLSKISPIMKKLGSIYGSPDDKKLLYHIMNTFNNFFLSLKEKPKFINVENCKILKLNKNTKDILVTYIYNPYSSNYSADEYIKEGWPVLLSNHKSIYYIKSVIDETTTDVDSSSLHVTMKKLIIEVPINFKHFGTNGIIMPLNQFDGSFTNEEILKAFNKRIWIFHSDYKY